jgi:uncharacterized protein YdeI (YjbR/CyaY-like superfamily)
MQATYKTVVIGEGNHASLHIPDAVLATLGANRRAPLKITINNHTYRSTATAVAGECRVVFPLQEREAAGVASGEVTVTLELETGHRQVDLHPDLAAALEQAGLRQLFEVLSYSKRREFARLVAEAKAEDTRTRRMQKIVSECVGLTTMGRVK